MSRLAPPSSAAASATSGRPSLPCISSAETISATNLLLWPIASSSTAIPPTPFSACTLSSIIHFAHLSQTHMYLPCLPNPTPSLGLRRLTIEGCFRLAPVLPTIFSIDSLESLSLMSHFSSRPEPYHILPSGITLTCLRSLSLQLFSVEPASLSRLVSELCSLEDLHLDTLNMNTLRISSPTIKRLKLTNSCYRSELHTLELFLPSLQSLLLYKFGSFSSLFHIHGEFPLLKRASIILNEVHGEDVDVVSKLLNSFRHVEELTLYVKESEYAECPKPILLQPGKDLLKFPNLKHLDVSLCFHEHNFEAITMMLHNCPALESLKLVHKIPEFTLIRARGRKKKDWRSRLPRSANGNSCYAYFRNLHLGEKRKEFTKLLRKKCSYKRRAQN